MASLLQSFKVLVDPIDGMKKAVDDRSWAPPLIALTLTAAVSGAAFTSRLDAGPALIQQLEMQGELNRLTEQELATKITTAHRLQLVSAIARGLVGTPVLVLMLAVVLQLVGWLLGARGTFPKYLSSAALALLPLAVFYLAFGLSAIRQPVVTPEQVYSLLPSSLAAFAPNAKPVVLRLLSAVDFFNLWSVGLLGLGLSVAAGIRRSRAFVVGLVLYLAYVGVFLIGLPGMRGGPA